MIARPRILGLLPDRFFKRRVAGMFENPEFNLLAGALLAGIVGVATAFIVRLIENAFRRRSVARAIFTEMIQALNQGIYAVGFIDKACRFKDPNFSTVHTEIVRMLRPLDRNILPTLGEGMGCLSPDALISAVAFEGTMESESRRMGEPSFDTPESRITAKELRNRICWSLNSVADCAEVVAVDAYRGRQKMHEENSRIINQARELAKTADPPPGDGNST